VSLLTFLSAPKLSKLNFYVEDAGLRVNIEFSNENKTHNKSVFLTTEELVDIFRIKDGQ
jgi:hypothetical protein